MNNSFRRLFNRECNLFRGDYWW